MAITNFYLENIRKLVATSGLSKTAAPEAVHSLGERIRNEYPIWEHTEFIEPAIRFFSEQAAG